VLFVVVVGGKGLPKYESVIRCLMLSSSQPRPAPLSMVLVRERRSAAARLTFPRFEDLLPESPRSARATTEPCVAIEAYNTRISAIPTLPASRSLISGR
jgi:hypothetical protein